MQKSFGLTPQNMNSLNIKFYFNSTGILIGWIRGTIFISWMQRG